MFDATAFLDASLPVGSTEVEVIPEGEYIATLDKMEFRSTPGKKDPSKTWTFLDHKWTIDDPNLAETLGRQTVVAFGSMILDITDSGGLDMSKGRNVSLNRLRDALGVNESGRSLSAAIGRTCRVRITHRMDNEGKPRAEVSAFIPL